MEPKWFKWIMPVIVLLTVLSFVPLVVIYLNRGTNSALPRVSIIPDMDNQQKFKTQSLNTLFADHRSMRPRVPGTIARGMLNDDDHYYRGISGGQWATAFPAQVELTDELMARGQERFTIYCAPCHGLDGAGSGMVALRAGSLPDSTFIPPVSYHSDTVRQRPVGHLFNTISNGIRTMPAYGTQIPVHDRWAIVAYIRALQLSQNASLSDVPPEMRDSLLRQAAAESAAPGTPAAAPATPDAAPDAMPEAGTDQQSTGSGETQSNAAGGGQ